MKRLIVCVFLIYSCAAPEYATSFMSNATPNEEDRALSVKQEKERQAWLEVENEDIVSYLETLDKKNWMVFDNIILIRPNSLINGSNKYYSRIAVFYDGTLFTDGINKEISISHKNRLIHLYAFISIIKEGERNGKEK